MNARLYGRWATLVLTFAAGCASTGPPADWTDPSFAGRSLSGREVTVRCDATDPVLRQFCEDSVMTELRSRGATPVLVAPAPAPAPGGAAATLAVHIEAVEERSGSPFSIGLGGFSGGHGGVGGGIGVAVPIGGGSVTDVVYAADGRLIDVATGRLMWSGRARTSAAGDRATQVAYLTRRVVDAAGRAGFFAPPAPR